VPIQLVYPHARLLSPNVRAFVDLAHARLGGREASGRISGMTGSIGRRRSGQKRGTASARRNRA
jgi:hypothetical protein